MKNFFKKKWVKIVLVILAIAAVLAIMSGKKNTKVSYRTATAEVGDIVSSVSGSGAITATESRKEISKVSGTIDKIYFDEGDEVNEGEVIIKIDSSDYEVNLNSQKTSVKQAEISKENLTRQVNNLNIKATAEGTVSNLMISEGAYIANYMSVCDIVSTNRYEVTLQFLSSVADRIGIGNNAKVLLTDSYMYIDGTVTYVGTGKTTLATGSVVVDVKILVDNSDYSLNGVSARASIIANDGAMVTSSNSAAFRPAVSSSVLSQSSGKIAKINVKNGQYVKPGEIIATLENEDLVASLRSTTIALQNAKEQLKYASDKLEDYKIKAPLTGTITAQSLKEGDIIGAGTIVTTVSNTSEFEFKVPIDELDISKLSKDNEVLVTVDAIPETEDAPIKGRISKIPLEGVTVGGVTDYYITIAIPKMEGIKISMNASAEIILNRRENVVKVPLEAISKENGENFVEILNGEELEKRKVTIGISDSSYAEIVEGVSAGDEVFIPDQAGGLGMFGM